MGQDLQGKYLGYKTSWDDFTQLQMVDSKESALTVKKCVMDKSENPENAKKYYLKSSTDEKYFGYRYGRDRYAIFEDWTHAKYVEETKVGNIHSEWKKKGNEDYRVLKMEDFDDECLGYRYKEKSVVVNSMNKADARWFKFEPTDTPENLIANPLLDA